jgi:hypothetical protein
MGWSYRRSLSVGGVRLNLSSRGVGYSVGGPAFRVGVRASGRTYVSSGIPGTGLRYETTLPEAKGCMLTLVVLGSTAAAGLGLGLWVLI